VSIGIAFDDQTDAKANDLLACADRAMRRAKEQGGDQIAVFDADVDARLEPITRQFN
jgi:GGDEF domain-containing protein